MTTQEERQSKLKQKIAELNEAQERCDKYAALAPLNGSNPPGHNMHEMKKDFDRLNKLRQELKELERNEMN